ncbi:MAG: PD40 domain-containing protein [Anaerolineales bacterium]|nr:PD40 domain-containing protein [Anaerolineales bacterium]
MKLNFNRFFLFLFLFLLGLFAFTACTQPTPVTRPTQEPEVPSIAEVDASIAKWDSGNNTRYTVTVEEQNRNGTFRYRIVIADGQVRAAQQQAKVDGTWQAPTAMDLTLAQNYTVDALFARLRSDVLGVDEVPMDIYVIFDPLSGFPSAVEAKALPTYNAEGNLQLNRELGYTFTIDVKVLIEDTVGQSKSPLLTLTRSGGEQAYCDILRIYEDGSSIYSDDCREVLLQLTTPPQQQARLVELAQILASIDETRDDAGTIYHLILAGTGTETAQEDQVWTMGIELAELLSHPIGAGITLLYFRDGQMYGFDMRAVTGQPANVEVVTPLYGMITKMDGSLLAYGDAESLHWLDLTSGDTGIFFANPPDGHYLPRGWNHLGQLLLQRFSGDAAPEWGWTSRDDPVWHPIGLPAGAFACDTGVSLAPSAAEFVIAAGGDCTQDTGLSLVSINDGSVRKLIDAQKVPGSGAFAPMYSPDGTWITFSLTLMDTPDNPHKVFLMRADGSEMAPITENATGRAEHPIWSGNGSQIYFSLHGADTGEDGIYVYNLADTSTALVFTGTDLSPVSISPSEEFLAFFTGPDLKSFTLDREELVSISRGNESSPVSFIGWLDTRTDK